ncbi:MAG: SPOR domain-containing protein [Sodalis sp. (in: enterobacteria)]
MQPDRLNNYARQQRLTHYWVYQTRRDGKPWYVLVSGVYPSLLQAKNAMSQLSSDMQTKKPWVRQIGQVKKDQDNSAFLKIVR